MGLLFEGRTRATFDALDRTLAAFVGPPDSRSLSGLATALAALPADLAHASDDQIVAAFVGPAAQRIRTQLVDGDEQSIAFVLLGQRYVFDAHVLSNLVYRSLDTAPARWMPSPLDVAYAVFGNPAAHHLLAPELTRYGARYADALERERRAADAQLAELRAASLYHHWLDALRTLSPDPARDASLPAPLTSDAWSHRMLNTQLASWAELRHDNILYAKQSVTFMATCEYPDGYIDPYPAFYGAMEAIALEHEPVIADVHTQPTDADGAPVGRVLHVATAMPRMFVVTIAHDGGAHAQTYRGFVATYSEIIARNFHRITDDEWLRDLALRPPLMPPWLADIVAP